MKYSRFSRQSFDRLGRDGQAARQRANELQDAVAKELHPSVLRAFRRIVERLNAAGHKLKPYGRIRVGDIGFRERRRDGSFGLRLSCDVVISSGYAHVVFPKSAEALSEHQWDTISGHALRTKTPNKALQGTRRKRRAPER